MEAVAPEGRQSEVPEGAWAGEATEATEATAEAGSAAVGVTMAEAALVATAARGRSRTTCTCTFRNDYRRLTRRKSPGTPRGPCRP